MNLKKLKDIVNTAYDFAEKESLDTSRVEVEVWASDKNFEILNISQSYIDGSVVIDIKE